MSIMKTAKQMQLAKKVAPILLRYNEIDTKLESESTLEEGRILCTELADLLIKLMNIMKRFGFKPYLKYINACNNIKNDLKIADDLGVNRYVVYLVRQFSDLKGELGV